MFRCLGEQLSLWFAEHDNMHTRRKEVEVLTADSAAELLLRAAECGTGIFLTRSAKEFLRKKQNPILTNNASWILSSTGKPSLFVAKEFEFGAALPRHKWIARTLISADPLHGELLSIPQYRLPDFLKEVEAALSVEGAPFPYRSKSFSRVLNEATSAMKRRTEILRLQQAKDAKVPGVELELAERLFPHQRVAVSYLMRSPQVFLGDDMGLGKTLSVLAAFQGLLNQDQSDFLLVVCPNSLVKNWQREAEQWTPQTKLLSLPDGKQKRIAFLRKLGQYDLDWVRGLVLHFELLRLEDVYPVLAKICAGRRTMLCIDESQRSKNPQSKIFTALQAVATKCPRRVLLSGTPAPRDISDLWAQMNLLDGGERLGTKFYRWLEEVAELGNKWSDYAVKKYRPEGVEETIAKVNEVLLRRRKEDVLSLPEKIFSVRDISLKGDQKKRYEEVRKALLVRLSTSSGETYVREIDSILEQFLRAVQIASNPRLVDSTWKGEPAKFLELDTIVDELVEEQGEKLVVWTNYRDNVKELVQRYSSVGVAGFSGDASTEERAERIKAFQEGSELKLLVAIPAAGGVGITLTAAQTAVYLEKTWNAEHWLQSVDRLHRIGQKGAVHIVSLHSCLIDNIIYKNLRKKESMLKKVMGDHDQELGGYPTKGELLKGLES